MIFRRLQGIQLMLAESRLHRNFANTFNMALILTIWALDSRESNWNRISIKAYFNLSSPFSRE